VGGESIQIVHYFDHGFLEEEKSMIYSFTVTFGAKYLIGMVTSVPPSKLSILLKVIFFISLKTTKITSKIQISEVGHVTYSFKNRLFISTGIFYDKLRPQNAPLN
jgi:hypothetical protein